MRGERRAYKLGGVRIAIATPAARGTRHGNRVTALRWALFLRRLGHRVRVGRDAGEGGAELLIAVHAEKSAAAVRDFRARRPAAPIVVALGGTDLYRTGGLSETARATLELATRVVALQPRARAALPPELQARTRVIVQSAAPPVRPSAPRASEFHVVALGHLRPVKEPLLAAEAARRLPRDSRVTIVHVGAAMDSALAARAEAESARNPRWSWVGPLPRRAALGRLAGARLALSTSRAEGGANFLSEALALGVPPLATDAEGNRGLLGDDYPGLFPVGDATTLAELLTRCEREPAFREALAERARDLADLVDPEVECAAWRALLGELGT